MTVTNDCFATSSSHLAVICQFHDCSVTRDIGSRRTVIVNNLEVKAIGLYCHHLFLSKWAIDEKV